ncbi:TetR family transcriptional regulator [Azospirillum sp. sgz302134]
MSINDTATDTDKNRDTDSTLDDLNRRVAAAAMRLAAEKGWRRTGLLEVARAAGVPLGDFYRRFPDRADVLGAVSRIADMAVLEGAVLADEAPLDPEESARDRLFDVMMRRYDALLPYREGLRSVMRDLRAEPLTALAFSRQFGRSMAWMLRAAGVEADRLGGAVMTAGLGAVQARVMRVFLDDDTADLARTMAALDAELRRGERWAGTLRRRPEEAPRQEPSGASIG